MTSSTRLTPTTHITQTGQTVVRTSSCADFLTLVPQLLGMQPRNSVVLVAFRGKRTHGAMRMDLPDTRDAKALGRFANTYVGLVCKIDGADGVAPIVYSDRSFAEAGAMPSRDLLDRIVGRATRAGLAVKDAACVASDGYGSLFDDDLPVGGHPLTDLRLAADFGARFGDGPELDGLRARPEPLDLGAAVVLPDFDAADRRGFDEAVAFWSTPQGVGWESLIDGFLDGRDPTECLESVLFPSEPEELDGWLPMLAAIADFPVLRDVALLQFGWGRSFGEYTFDRTVKPPRQALEFDDLPVLALSGGDMARPDPARLDVAIERVTLAAAQRSFELRAPLLTMLAWMHWAQGHGSIAGAFVDAALRADPGYGLADLLHIMLDQGMVPEWSFRPVPINPASRQWARSAQQ